MRNSKSLAVAVTLAFLLAAAPMHAAPRTRDSDPIVRFVKFVKKVFGVSTHTEVTIPIPQPTP
ncbi:MAG TPA: hypothetical protein VMU84_08185 [Thermoanaerobaculia bacterium]|nr:hypothetical protein [Thermoanaerobaculia bacterium]